MASAKDLSALKLPDAPVGELDPLMSRSISCSTSSGSPIERT